MALEDEGSFTRAAARCGVTQSTLSAGIKALEDLLGQALVNKGRKDVTLNGFGGEVARAARDILSDTDRIVNRARQVQAPLSGPLRLGVIPTIAPYFLPEVLPVLQARFPALELQLYEDLSDRLVQKLGRGALDLLLMAFPYETPGMAQMFLFEEPFYLACARGQEPEGGAPRVGDLDADDLLLLEDGHCLRDHALAACGLQDVARRKAYSATSLQTLVQMVGHGYGMTLLPEMAVQAGDLPRGVVALAFDDPPPMRQIGLVWRRGSGRAAEFETLGRMMSS